MSRLGELLVRENLISLQQLQKAQEEQKKNGARLGYSLTKLGIIQEQDLTNFLSKQYGVPSINLAEWEIGNDIIALVPAEARESAIQLIPVNRTGATLIVAMADPANIYAIDDLKFRTGLNIEVAVASEVALDEAIVQKYYEKQVDLDDIIGQMDTRQRVEVADTEGEVSVIDLEKGAGEAPVIKLVQRRAAERDQESAGVRAIHIEPYEEELPRPATASTASCTKRCHCRSKLKNAMILAHQDHVAARHLRAPLAAGPGRASKLKIGKDKEMDFKTRLGLADPVRREDRHAPSRQGEPAARHDEARLRREAAQRLHEEHLYAVRHGARDGPHRLGQDDVALLRSPGAQQEHAQHLHRRRSRRVQPHGHQPGADARGRRVELRDRAPVLSPAGPDIIMVGEIRVFETGEIAVKAALTGHLVLSTLHTNDAPSTISRLLNMGVEPFLVTASVNLVLAQRLARRICAECKQPVEKNMKALLDLGMKPEMAERTLLFKGAGCAKCSSTGYKGRIALYEVMPFFESVKELVLQGASTAEVKAEAIRSGMQSLRMSGLQKLAEGITTPVVVLRVSVAD